MINIFMDATIFFFFRQDSSAGCLKTDFEEFLEDLLAWRSIEEVAWCDVFQSARTAEALFDAGRYPLWNDLELAMRHLGLSENYQAKDIVNLVDGLLTRLQLMEDRVQIGAVLMDPFSVSPSRVAPLEISLQAHFDHVLSLVATGETVGFIPSVPNYIANRVYDKATGHVDVAGQIAVWETTHPRAPEIQLPLKLAARVLLTMSRSDVERSLNIPALCTACCDEGLFKGLLEIAVSQVGGDTVDAMEWTFGKTFFSSARALHMFSDPTKTRGLVETCVDTILKRNLAQVHRIRENLGANSLPRKRSAAFALRRDIDHEFHIHYWSDDRTCEFARVVVHGDFTIPND